MKKGLVIGAIVVFVIVLTILFSSSSKKDVLEIHIGYQSVTSQTWGALIIKNQRIFENKLKEVYPNKDIKVVWHDEISGAVINTNMISGKMDLGFMGDMPLILNMYKSATLSGYDSKLIAFDGKGKNGKNQSIIVPKDSDIKDIFDLKGKTISTPIGSSAHFMLMKVLNKYNMLDDVTIVHQDVALASQLLLTNKIQAFSVWEPYPLSLSNNDIARILIDGSESDIDYLAGVIVNDNWAKKNSKIVNLFIDSLNEAHDFINKEPEKAAKIFSLESNFDYNITIKEAKNIIWETNISNQDIETLKEKMNFLVDLKKIEDYDLESNVSKGE